MSEQTMDLEAVFKSANLQLLALEGELQRRFVSHNGPKEAPEISQDCLSGIDDFINDLRREHLDANATAKPLESLAELLPLHDERFVDAAYLSILKRHPDPEGRHHFLESMRNGSLSKIEILGRLRYSAEGRRQGVPLNGLLPRYGVKTLARLPILGGFVRFVLAVAKLPSLLGSMQRLEAATFRETQQVDDKTAAKLQQMSEAIRAAIANLSGQANLAFSEISEREGRYVPLSDFQALQSAVDNVESRFEKLFVERLNEVLDAHERRYESRFEQLRNEYEWLKRFEPPSNEQLAGIARSSTQADGTNRHGFYARFEERFRGSRTDILERLQEVLPYATPPFVLGAPHPAIDLGCGRGEWLELLARERLPSIGVDLDDDFVAACRAMNLKAEKADALGYLRAVPTASVPLVSAFHLIEHFSIRDLLSLLDECRRVLVPGGRILFETPNPENVTVGANHFWYDYTHVRPLAPDLMQFFLEDRGFENVQIARLRKNRLVDDLTYVDTAFPYNHQLNSLVTLAKQHLVSSPDYAIVAEIAQPAAAT